MMRTNNNLCSSSSSSQNSQSLTMEQVWKDLNFPNTTTTTLQNQPNSGVIFQDFMGAGSSSSSNINKETAPPPPPPRRPTGLSLNSSFNDFDYGVHRQVDYNGAPPPFNVSSAYSEAINVGSTTSSNVELFAFCPPDQRTFCNIGHDHKNKRLMKNRESAARSRARKQAYTKELELEVAHLVEENEKLRKQYEELRLAMATQHSTKKPLHRTSTAPF